MRRWWGGLGLMRPTRANWAGLDGGRSSVAAVKMGLESKKEKVYFRSNSSFLVLSFPSINRKIRYRAFPQLLELVQITSLGSIAGGFYLT